MSDLFTPPLAGLDVVVVDCQATAAAPNGHLLELGWGRDTAAPLPAQARLIRLPDEARVPPAVARITGITDRLLRDAVPAQTAWTALLDFAGAASAPFTPTVIHFAQFERPYLHALAGGPPPLDIVCTHDIARRLLPDLPRRSLRALAGYFGYGVASLRRSAEHVEATRFVWRALLPLLEQAGVTTWGELRAWLAVKASPRPQAGRKRVWPMPRELRLSLPDVPGIYRMLRTSGDVLYVGKATSLHHRVNSYFRHQRGVSDRHLEMLSQARRLSFTVTATPLEAAMLEPDEIKRHRPPYNIALTEEDRQVWFTKPDLSGRSHHPWAGRCLGPFPSGELLEQFAALADGDRSSLGRGRWAPEPQVFAAGYTRLTEAHPALVREARSIGSREAWLRLGHALWRQGRRDRAEDDEEQGSASRVPEWSAESVQAALERLALRAAIARWRAVWLTQLCESVVAWSEPGDVATWQLVVTGGAPLASTVAAPGPTQTPPEHGRSAYARHQCITLATFDRMRVLSTELKRLVSAGAPVVVRLGPARALTGDALTRALLRV